MSEQFYREFQSRGRAAELEAKRIALSRGLEILAENFRVGRDELDLVAREGTTLVVIEVRYRCERALVPAHTSLDARKLRALRRGARLAFASLQGASLNPIRHLRIDLLALDGRQWQWIRNISAYGGEGEEIEPGGV